MTVDEKLIAFANRLADASGAVIRPFFRQRIEVAHKSGTHAFDPVTEADRGAERAIRAIIERERPDDAILGEEYAEKPGRNSLRWVLDPVDGTRAFITGRHEWGSLIALEDNEIPVLGLLDQPVLGERFLGVNGRSVLIEAGKRTPLHVRECGEMGQAILCATDPGAYFSLPQQTAFQRVKSAARMTRYCGDCYLFAALAMGFVDIVIEANFNRWDVAALIPLVEGAGGVITAWDGGDCRDGKTILACGDRRIHQEAIKLLKH
ncbi:MAG TPA: histidinol-phosphatase [Rhizomicrobium sp.]|nr:histidinol-phosphatase [Rhizomicrobium sp.]